MEETQAEQLFEELCSWYLSVARDYAAIPQAFAGITISGKRFIALLDGIELNHVERHQFVKFALEREKAVAFVYGSLTHAFDDSQSEPVEELAINAGTANHYRFKTWAVKRLVDPKRIELIPASQFEGSNPGEVIGAWFLTPELTVPDQSLARFLRLWESMEKDLHRYSN